MVKKKNGGINKLNINMKSINNYISEKLVINRNVGKIGHTYFPKTKDELQDIIEQRIKKEGYECDLNDIDVSEIKDMSKLFYGSKFNGDISEWNVCNVTNMIDVFAHSEFNQDISKWDVGNVTKMSWMFAFSKFNQDISKWNVSNVNDMEFMFAKSEFNKDISNWDVSKVKRMNCMFCDSKFNQDISNWYEYINNVNMDNMFKNSPLEGKEWDWFEYNR